MSGEASAKDLMVRLWDTSERLKSAGIWHEIRGFRQDGVSILAHVPGEYWEIDFLEDGKIDVEVFRTTGALDDESAIERLLSEHSEPNTEVAECP